MIEYYSRSYLEFCLETERDDFKISDIDLILELESTYQHQKGESIEYNPKAISSVWIYKLPDIQSFKLDESLLDLVNVLSEKKKELALINSEGIYCMIDIVTYKAIDEDVGLDLNIELIGILYELGISLHHNIYDFVST